MWRTDDGFEVGKLIMNPTSTKAFLAKNAAGVLALVFTFTLCHPPRALAGFGHEFVRNHPFHIAGGTDRTPLSAADIDTYVNTWNATGADVLTPAGDRVPQWDAAGVPWVKWVTPGIENADGTMNPWSLGDGWAPLIPANFSHRYGYHIGGEPRTQAETNEVIRTAAALKAYDPGSFIYVGLNTDATDAMEDQMMSDPNMDGVIGHRYYSNNTSYANLAHTRALGLRHNKPYFRFLRSFKSRPEFAEPYDLTASDYRFKAFSSLTYGYTGIVWFTYNLKESESRLLPRLFTTTETYQFSDRNSPAFEETSAVNQELFYLGEETKHLLSTDVRLHVGDNAVYSQPFDTTDWSPGAGNDSFITGVDQLINDDMDILIGFFEHFDNQEKYFMLQNTAHAHGDTPSIYAGTIRVDFDFSSATDPLLDKTQLQKVDRTTGLWTDVSLNSDGGDMYHLNALLEAGGADLFRYKFSENLSGDYNGNGIVDAADYTAWRDTLGQTVPSGNGADGDGNGFVNAADYGVWKTNFGSVQGGQSALAETAIPEPTSVTLLLFGLAGCLAMRRCAARCR